MICVACEYLPTRKYDSLKITFDSIGRFKTESAHMHDLMTWGLLGYLSAPVTPLRALDIAGYTSRCRTQLLQSRDQNQSTHHVTVKTLGQCQETQGVPLRACCACSP
jgi:hypothetical protein